MRPRPAPIAARIAISRRRPEARASSRFATFAQAISRTSATALSRTQSVERTSLTSSSCRLCDVNAALRSSAVGYRWRYSLAESFRRACAWSSETPGFSRPATWK